MSSRWQTHPVFCLKNSTEEPGGLWSTRSQRVGIIHPLSVHTHCYHYILNFRKSEQTVYKTYSRVERSENKPRIGSLSIKSVPPFLSMGNSASLVYLLSQKLFPTRKVVLGKPLLPGGGIWLFARSQLLQRGRTAAKTSISRILRTIPNEFQVAILLGPFSSGLDRSMGKGGWGQN